MKRELRDKWCVALRSNEFMQGNGLLKFLDVDGNLQFCCMGVLVEIDGAEWTLAKNHDERMQVVLYFYKTNCSCPDAGEFGLKDYEIAHLWRMNDLERKTFPEIADWIEENIPTED